MGIQLTNCNQPFSLDNMVPIAIYKAADSYRNMEEVLGMYRTDIFTMRDKYRIMGKKCRLFLTGYYDFLCNSMGHMGPSSLFPCLWCHTPKYILDHPGDKVHSPVIDLDTHSLEGNCVKNASWFERRTPLTVHRDHTLRTTDPRDDDASMKCAASERYHSILHPQIFPITDTDEDLLNVVPPFSHILVDLVQRYFVKVEEVAKEINALNALKDILENDLGFQNYSQGFSGDQCERILENCRKLLRIIAPHRDYAILSRLFSQLYSISSFFPAAFLSSEQVNKLCHLCWNLGNWFPVAFPSEAIPLALHILICHVPEFAMKWKTVGLMSEQDMKTMHGTINLADETCTSESPCRMERTKLVFGKEGQQPGQQKKKVVRKCPAPCNGYYKTFPSGRKCQICHAPAPDAPC